MRAIKLLGKHLTEAESEAPNAMRAGMITAIASAAAAAVGAMTDDDS